MRVKLSRNWTVDTMPYTPAHGIRYVWPALQYMDGDVPGAIYRSLLFTWWRWGFSLNLIHFIRRSVYNASF